uniref:Tudor domain-containing protein n=1 Tax=Loa loa TaxID=7209 RepID=A0A1I7VP59_LOALO
MEQNGNFLASKGIVWKNIVSKAPWSGGVYERMIGLTKKALRRAIGRKLLWERELITLITEIEDSDGNIRSATVKTSSGKLLNRPINVLYPMEVNEEDSDEVRTTKSKDETDDGPIASRTRGAERKQKLLQTSMVQRASSITLMVTIIFSLLIQVTLAGNLILQKDDIMVKGINGTLFIGPCEPKIDVPKPNKLISGIIDQFKIEKITAELEILSQEQQFDNGQYVRPTWSLADEINQESNELSIQFDKTSEFIQEELNNLTTNWKLFSNVSNDRNKGQILLKQNQYLL